MSAITTRVAHVPYTIALVLVGLGFAVVYYFLFRFGIKILDAKIPGREDDIEAVAAASVPAAEAERLGLLNGVVPDEALLPEVRERARRLARRAPASLALTKKLLNAAADADRRAGIQLESLAQSVASRGSALFWPRTPTARIAHSSAWSWP